MGNRKQKSKRNPGAAGAKKPVRLSQCMIVKNEEKNIIKALSWAKDVACEQIVVDTGSTDRTVELAESMGAKIYHFEWINDFSAAKNFAIEQATGSWIAFLDADEYFLDDDTKKLMEILERLTNGDAAERIYVSVTCPWIQVDDKGVPFGILSQCRIFRNRPDMRYKGSIHEALPLHEESNLQVPEIGIIHTGYSASAYKDTNKSQRNIEILENELAKKSDSADLKCYLADSLHSEGSPKSRERAVALYAEALDDEKSLNHSLAHSAYLHLIVFHSNHGDPERAIGFCRRAALVFPDVPDFYAYLGILLHDKKDYAQAWEALKKCEQTLSLPVVSDFVRSSVISNPIILFSRLANSALQMGNISGAVHYSVLTLKENKYEKDVLIPLLQLLSKDENTSDEDIFGLLGRLYDLGNKKDRAFILVCSKMVGNRAIFDMTRSLFSADEIERMKIPKYEEGIGESGTEPQSAQ